MVKYNDTSLQQVAEIVSDELTWLIMRVLMFVVTPAISAFGVVGNIFSINVLIKQGMGKCSNILLVSLAFSDITFLVSFNSVPKIIYEAVWNHKFVGYSRTDAHVLFSAFVFFTLFDYAGGLMSLTLPMLITAERLVVIFFPLTFKRFITPPRTWLAVWGVAAFWLSVFTYSSFWYDLGHDLDPMKNTSVGFIKWSEFYYENLHVVAAFDDLLIYSSMILPPLLTILGCLVISVKIKITSLRRDKMTSKRRSESRTTKTLLAVCAVYTVTAAFLSLPLYAPQYASYSLTDASPSNIGKIIYQLENITVCMNSSSNFVISSSRTNILGTRTLACLSEVGQKDRPCYISSNDKSDYICIFEEEKKTLRILKTK